MEPEGSLLRPQELSTCTYPEPDQSSPQHSIISLKGPFLMLSLHLRLGLPSGLFPSGFPIDNLYKFLLTYPLLIKAIIVVMITTYNLKYLNMVTYLQC
jgi:hypothetical protein